MPSADPPSTDASSGATSTSTATEHAARPFTTVVSILLSALLAASLTGVLYIYRNDLPVSIDDFRPRCSPFDICPWYAVRAPLPDGRPSTRVFDVPRRLLAGYPPAVVRTLSATASLVAHANHPRIVVFDNTLDPGLLSRLREYAAASLKEDRADQPHGIVSDAFSPHYNHELVNSVTDRLVKLAAFPDRHYAESLNITSYVGPASVERVHPAMAPADLNEEVGRRFGKCRRVATVTVTLEAPKSGGVLRYAPPEVLDADTDASESSLVVRDEIAIKRIPPHVGRAVVMYGMHPLHEQLDSSAWEAVSDIEDGEWLAVRVHVRMCSHLEAAGVRDMMRRFDEHMPTSIVMPEVGKIGRNLGTDDDDEYEYEDEDDYDYEDEEDENEDGNGDEDEYDDEDGEDEDGEDEDDENEDDDYDYEDDFENLQEDGVIEGDGNSAPVKDEVIDASNESGGTTVRSAGMSGNESKGLDDEEEWYEDDAEYIDDEDDDEFDDEDEDWDDDEDDLDDDWDGEWDEEGDEEDEEEDEEGDLSDDRQCDASEDTC